MNEYVYLQLNKDLTFVRNYEKNSDANEKLMALMALSDGLKIKIHHCSIRQKLLPVSVLSSMLSSSSEIERMIKDSEIATSGEKDELYDEIKKEIRKSVEVVYDQRYRGAKQRIIKHASPYLKNVLSAVRSSNRDAFVCAAERFCIQTESLPDNHYVFVAYSLLKKDFMDKILK